MKPNPDYDSFPAHYYRRARIPYTEAVLVSYPSITGELVLALVTPGEHHIVHVWRPEEQRAALQNAP